MIVYFLKNKEGQYLEKYSFSKGTLKTHKKTKDWIKAKGYISEKVAKKAIEKLRNRGIKYKLTLENIEIYGNKSLSGCKTERI